MAINFTDILITLTDLRDRIGAPSNNPNSQTYITDASLTTLITLKQKVVEEIVERRMESLSNDEIRAMDVTFDPVNITMTQGTKVASGDIPADNLPVIERIHLNDGTHLEIDLDIHDTANIWEGTGIVKYRFNVTGRKLLAIPNNAGTVVAYLPTLDEVRQILVADIIDQANVEIVNEAKAMLLERVKVSQGFKIEAQTEAP